MKDFFDILMISRQFNFDGKILVYAIRATFQQRQTVIPKTAPLVLTDEFATDRQKAIQWSAFPRKIPNQVAAIGAFFLFVIDILIPGIMGLLYLALDANHRRNILLWKFASAIFVSLQIWKIFLRKIHGT